MAELEALAVAWAAKKASFFLDGHPGFTVVTDCNPLVPILNDRRLDQIQNDRLLKLRTALERYSFRARWQAGTKHQIADAFSRAPRNLPTAVDHVLTPADDAEREFIVAAALCNYMSAEADPEEHTLAATIFSLRGTLSSTTASLDDLDPRLEEVRLVGARDATYVALIATIFHGWPAAKQDVPEELRPYYAVRENLMVEKGLILVGARLLIPAELIPATLRRLHAAHQGIAKTLDRARRTVWWPTLTNDVTQTVQRCSPCLAHRPAHAHEPLQELPDATRPFQKVHSDLFQMDQTTHYMVITDEYSGWPEIYAMGRDTTAQKVIWAIRNFITAHGRPDIFKSDNGPQFVAQATVNFLEKWRIKPVTSSPYMPQTNGRAEAAVKAMKRIIRGCTGPDGTVDQDDLIDGLLAFRNTPRYGGRSPAQLAYGQNVGERLPTHPLTADPRFATPIRALDETAETNKTKLKANYDLHSRTLEPFPVGTQVAVRNQTTELWEGDGVITEALEKHDYLVKMSHGGTWRRNRRLLHRRLPALPGLMGSAPQPPRPATVPLPPPAPPAPAPQAPAHILDHQEWPELPAPSPPPGPARRSKRTRQPNKNVTGSDWVPTVDFRKKKQ